MTTVEQRALEWMAGSDTGASSKTIARHMMGLPHDDAFGVSEPSDGGDLGRCLRLLALVPEWEPRIGELAVLSNAWAALVLHWEELKALMIEETGPTFARDAGAPKTDARIQVITRDARKADRVGTSHLRAFCDTVIQDGPRKGLTVRESIAFGLSPTGDDVYDERRIAMARKRLAEMKKRTEK